MCFYNVKAQCLIPYILLFSKTATTGSSTALPPRSNLTPTPTPSWTSHHNIICESLPSCANSPAAEILQAIHCQFCHTSLYKKYIRGQDPVVHTLCLPVFQVELLSCIRTSVPGRRGSQSSSACLTRQKRNIIVGSAHVLYIYLQGNDGDGAAMHRQCGVDDRISVILRLSSNISMSVFESIKISWGNEKLASVGGFCCHFS